MLRPLMEKYNSFIVTEKQDYVINVGDIPGRRYRRTNGRIMFEKSLRLLSVAALAIVLADRPNVTVSTGALAAVPVMAWTKLFGGKVVYIESFAKISSPNLSGRLAYKFADRFYIQWESLRKFYPNAICKGGIY